MERRIGTLNIIKVATANLKLLSLPPFLKLQIINPVENNCVKKEEYQCAKIHPQNGQECFVQHEYEDWKGQNKHTEFKANAVPNPH